MENAAEGWSADHPKWSGSHVFCSDSLHVVPLGSLMSPILVLMVCGPWIHWRPSWLVGSSPFCVCLCTGSMTWRLDGYGPIPRGQGPEWAQGGGRSTTSMAGRPWHMVRRPCPSAQCCTFLQFDMFPTFLHAFWYLHTNIHAHLWKSLVARVAHYYHRKIHL